jgi:hypothetical protein
MNRNKPMLTLFERVDSYTWAMRFSCRDTDVWNEIRDTIMDFHRSERRWDPYYDNNRGAWLLEEDVVRAIAPYFLPERKSA